MKNLRGANRGARASHKRVRRFLSRAAQLAMGPVFVAAASLIVSALPRPLRDRIPGRNVLGGDQRR